MWAILVGFCLRDQSSSLDNKDEPSNCTWYKKTYIHATINHIADVQGFSESNLWVKNTKYKKIRHSMQRMHRWSMDKGKNCECGESNEAWEKMHICRSWMIVKQECCMPCYIAIQEHAAVLLDLRPRVYQFMDLFHTFSLSDSKFWVSRMMKMLHIDGPLYRAE